jgi:hypothetical protein
MAVEADDHARLECLNQNSPPTTLPIYITGVNNALMYL